MEDALVKMDRNRLRDVLNLKREQIHHNDPVQILPVDNNTNTRYGEEHKVALERSKTFQAGPVQHAYDVDDVSRQHVTHRRIHSNFGDEAQHTINFDQPTSYTSQASYSRLDYPPELWRPFWLRKSTLGVLLLLFMVVGVGLVLLWHFSHQSQGFDINSSTSYYAWRLAPLALVIIIINLWRPVEYYFKVLAPWDELRKGPILASHGLLLDYVSTINVVSLVTACKRGNIPVFLSIAVLVILKLIAIFSAALMVPISTVLNSNSTSAYSTKVFSASIINLSAFTDIAPFTPEPVYATLGNIAYGLPYKDGVRSEYAYIPVDLRLDSAFKGRNVTFVAETDVFFANLACVPLQVQVIGNTTTKATRTTANMTSNYITLQMPAGNICQSWNPTRIYTMNPQIETTPARQLEGTMQSVYCSGSQETDSQALEPAGLLFTMTDTRYTQAILSNGTIANSTRRLATIANVLCVPRYYMLKAEMISNSADSGADTVDIRIGEVENRTLAGLSAANLAVLYEGIMNASRGVFGSRLDNPQAFTIPSTVFNLMALVTNQSDIQPFLDAKTMGAAAENTFRRVMSHYAAQSLTTNAKTDVLAHLTYTQERLHLSLIPFCIILAGTVLAALLTSILCNVTPGPLVPKDPSLIATSATVLARSPELNHLLRNQISGKAAMAHVMSGHGFGSAIATTEGGQTSYKLVVIEAPSASRLPRLTEWQWWSPNTLLLPAFALVVTIPSALIGVLEYLQRYSNANQGLFALKPGQYTFLCIVCIPVLVTLLIAATIEYLDFYVQLLSPWNKLAEGNSNPRRSLLSHVLGRLPPIAFLEALRNAHFGAIFSIPATIFASVFVIFASGLYRIENVIMTSPPQHMVTNDTFQFQGHYRVLNDRGAAGLLRLIDNQNTIYPSGAFEDLVFPTYSVSSSENSSIGPFIAMVPALRASLRCDAVADSSIIVSYLPASRTYNSNRYQVDTSYYLPAGCQFGGIFKNSSVARFRNLFNVTSNNTVLYGGQLLDLVFGQNSSLVANYGETRAATTGDNPAIGWPSLAFTFAQISGKGQTPHITSLVCYQQIEQLKANVTYKPGFTELDPSHPPVAIKSSVSLLTNPNATTSINSFDWRIQRNIESQLFGLNGSRLRSPTSTSNYHFDAFFSYLLNNTVKQDPATWAGTSDRQVLTTTINNLYSKYMAQAINGNMRVTTDPNNNINRKRQSAGPITTVETHTLQSRLIQDPQSKLILQIFLGLSVLFTILAYLLTSFHCLLPRNPCSIAGTMSLLVGSDLCYTPEDTHLNSLTDGNEHIIPNGMNPPIAPRQQIIPAGAEWLNDRQFAAVFAGRRFSLGWWKEDRAKGRRRRFGVDVGSRPDGEHDDDWELGDRRPLGQHGFDGIIMKGIGMLGDQRGQYQRAEGRDGDSGSGGVGGDGSGLIGSAPTPRLPSAYGYPHRRDQGMALPLMQGVIFPRKVRFEDEA